MSSLQSLEAYVPYLVSLGVIAYGTLLVYTMNKSIESNIQAANLNRGDEDSEDELCRTEPLKFQAIAIGVIIVGVIAFLITMFSHHPKFFSNLVSFGDKHKVLGGNTYLNNILLLLVLVFMIYMWRKDSEHKHCMSQSVSDKWGSALYWTNRVLAVSITAYIVYMVYQYTQKKSE